MLRHESSSRGFTLIEVLVALVLMAIMSAMAWRGLDAMLRGREVTQSAIERSALLQTAMAQWEQDWTQLQDSGPVVPPQAFDGARLRLTRRTPQGLQVVTWFVEQGKLYRWAAAPATSLAQLRRAWERAEQPLVLAAERVVVLEGVADWQLYYFWDNAWANALSTGGEAPPAPKETPPAGAPPGTPPGGNPPPTGAPPPAPPERQAQLPRGVRVQISFNPGSGYAGPLVRQVLVQGGS